MRHEVRFALDSPLEGTGFELPVRGRGESGFGPFCVAPDCLFAFCLRRILRDLESIERGRQREGRIIDVGPDTLTVMLAGTPAKLDDFEDLMRPFGIAELQRTGRVALPKLERQAPRLRSVRGKVS